MQMHPFSFFSVRYRLYFEELFHYNGGSFLP